MLGILGSGILALGILFCHLFKLPLFQTKIISNYTEIRAIENGRLSATNWINQE